MILKLKSGKYIHVESYGIFSWGSPRQTRIINDTNNNWYVITSWPTDKDPDGTCTKLKIDEVLDKLPAGQTLYNQEEYDAFIQFFDTYKGD